MRDTPESEAKQQDGRLELSVAQVAGSALAAVAAAVLASRLGVYGTIIGAGVVSVVATAGGSVFQHVFHRTGEQLREVTVHHRPRARQVPRVGDGARAPAARSARAPAAAHPVRPEGRAPRAHGGFDRSGEGVAADSAATQALPALDAAHARSLPQAAAEPTQMVPRAWADTAAPEQERTRALPRVATAGDVAGNSGGERKGDHPDHTRVLRRVDEATRVLRRTESDSADVGGERRAQGGVGAHVAFGVRGEEWGARADAFTDATTHGTRVRGGKRLMLAALAVFLLAMALITGIEWVSGGPMANLWGADKSGTTFSNSVSRDAGSGSRPGTTPSDATPSGDAPSGDSPSDDAPSHGHPATEEGPGRAGASATPDPTGPDGDPKRPAHPRSTPSGPEPTGGGADQRTPGPAPSTPTKPTPPSRPGGSGGATPGTGGETGAPPGGGSATSGGDAPHQEQRPGGQPAGQGGTAPSHDD